MLYFIDPFFIKDAMMHKKGKVKKNYSHFEVHKFGAVTMTHLLVAVDKFTKWVEVEPIKQLDDKTAVEFL